MQSKTFYPGGMHVPDHKEQTKGLPIEEMKPCKDLYFPLSQHIGVPSEALVEKNDFVKVGQMIAKAQGNFSTPIHSSVSGVVKDIKEYPHPVEGLYKAIHIENDFQDIWSETISTPDLNDITLEKLCTYIQDAGIVGMGGAAFPTHMKLQTPPGITTDTLIINGAECEPYLTCDHRVMLEETESIMDGIEIIQSVLNFKQILIGIEENKPDAIQVLTDYSLHHPRHIPIQVVPLQKKYPQGAEKNLIHALTRRVVPMGKLPFSVGCIVQNVSTMAAISKLMRSGIPMIDRVITLSGDCLRFPKNVRVRMGTLLSDIVEFCGGFVQEPQELIFGGPMMGINQRSQDVPIIKGTSGIIFLHDLEDLNESNCIRCGKCIENCPMGLMPYRFVELFKNGTAQEADKYFASTCIECGVCTYNCPARIPILNYIRTTKKELQRTRSNR